VRAGLVAVTEVEIHGVKARETATSAVGSTLGFNFSLDFN